MKKFLICFVLSISFISATDKVCPSSEEEIKVKMEMINLQMFDLMEEFNLNNNWDLVEERYFSLWDEMRYYHHCLMMLNNCSV
jgi:hypothetical protein